MNLADELQRKAPKPKAKGRIVRNVYDETMAKREAAREVNRAFRKRMTLARAESALELALRDVNRALTKAAKCEARVIELRKGAA